MFKRFFKITFLILCVNIVFTDFVFAAKNDAKNLAKINKEIEAKKKATKALEQKTKKLNTEINQTQKKMVQIANNVKKYEKQLTGYDKELATLKSKEKTLNKTIESNNSQLTKIIAVFQNISQVPKGYLITSQSKIDKVFQSSVLLRSIVTGLNESRIIFEQDLNKLIKLKDEITSKKLSIHSLNTKVKNEKDKISLLIKSKKSTQAKLSKEQEKNKRDIKRLVAESKTIEEFLKKAERLRKQQEAKKRSLASTMFKSTGSVPLPVSGRIITYFGQKKTTGVKAKGLYIKPRANSQVVSPSDADVMFAGSFYGYKNLLILHLAEDYYVIMGGMDEIYADEGQTLLAGEPIGQMGTDEFYIEIRKKETPINPLKYFKI